MSAKSGCCDYFHWAEPSLNASPSNSQAPSDSPSPSPSASVHDVSAPTASLARAVQVDVCAHADHHTKVRCKSTRVLPTCGRAMCRKHCKENGGCLGKLHAVEGSLNAVPARISGMSLPPSSQQHADQPRNAVSTSSQNPNIKSSMPVVSSSLPVPISTPLSGDDEANPTRDPRFISHMPDVFNKQYATQQRLQETKRAADEEQLRNKKKADETVMGYTFVEVCVYTCTLSYSCKLIPFPWSRMAKMLSLLCSRIT